MKFVIGKCPNCGNWHVVAYVILRNKMVIDYGIVATFTSWWDEVLLAINFPEMIKHVSA